MSSTPVEGDEVRLFLWDTGISDHVLYRALVRSVDVIGGAGGGQPRLDLSYSAAGVATNENNVRNIEAYTDFNAVSFWKGTQPKQPLTDSLPYESYNRANTYEGRCVWVTLDGSGSGGSRKAIILDQRAAPGNRIDLFYINIGASTRIALNNIKAIEDANVGTEDHWFRRRLTLGSV